jgi:hypothetical protein
MLLCNSKNLAMCRAERRNLFISRHHRKHMCFRPEIIKRRRSSLHYRANTQAHTLAIHIRLCIGAHSHIPLSTSRTNRGARTSFFAVFSLFLALEVHENLIFRTSIVLIFRRSIGTSIPGGLVPLLYSSVERLQ